MAMEYFCAYHSYLKATRNLTDEECGRLFRACLLYSMTGEETDLPGNERFVFDSISNDIDRAKAAYQRKSETNRRNIQKRWDKGKTDTDVYDRTYERIRPDTSEEVRIQGEGEGEREREGKGEGEGKGKGKGEGKSNYTSPETLSDDKVRRTPSDLDAVVAAWNRLGLNQIQKINPMTDRYKMTKCRIRDYGQDTVLKAIAMVADSDFLMGRAKDFVATFDWFIRPNNFDKVLSGNYANHSAPGKQPEKSWAELAAEMEAEMGVRK